MTDKELKKSRRTLLLMVAAFAVPIVLAKLALEQHWFNYGVTNQGELANNLSIEDFGLTRDSLTQGWLILYAVPNLCNEQCHNTLKGVNNSHIALGKDLSRATPVALVNSSNQGQEIQANSSRYWLVHQKSNQFNESLIANKVWVADPMGNIVLSFNPPENSDDMPVFGKAILADLKKLLKYSKMG